MARGPARGAGDGGVALVEFAMVLPVLMVLLLGMISGAIAWNQSQGLGQGARVAARYASTLPLPPLNALGAFDTSEMDEWLRLVADRAVEASEGTMGLGVDGRAVCVAYVDPAGTAADKTRSRRIAGAGPATSGNDWCFDDGQSTTERRVQVALERDGVLNIGIHRQVLDLRRSVVYRFEARVGL